MNPREKFVQQRVIALYKAFGCDVATLSQPRATMQTPGIPDLYVFPPRGLRAFWHETKRPKGARTSEGQVKWKLKCLHCQTDVVTGGVEDARAYLQRIGLVAHDGATILSVAGG